jgi:HPt (histidine-containing phosphotransfer) domain-containing protein
MLLSHAPAIMQDSVGRSPWTLPKMLCELTLDGEASFVLELIGTFQADTVLRLQAMRAAISVGNRAALKAQAHSAKGSSRQMGAIALAAICEELEIGPSDMPESQLRAYVETAEREFTIVCHEMGTASDALH